MLLAYTSSLFLQGGGIFKFFSDSAATAITSTSLTLPLLPPSYKDTHDYIRLTWIIQGKLPILKFLIYSSLQNPLCQVLVNRIGTSLVGH